MLGCDPDQGGVSEDFSIEQLHEEGKNPGVIPHRCLDHLRLHMRGQHAFAIHFITKEEIAALYFFTQVAEARSAPNPTFISEFIRPAGTRVEIRIEFPTPPRVDLENPEFHRSGNS